AEDLPGSPAAHRGLWRLLRRDDVLRDAQAAEEDRGDGAQVPTAPGVAVSALQGKTSPMVPGPGPGSTAPEPPLETPTKVSQGQEAPVAALRDPHARSHLNKDEGVRGDTRTAIEVLLVGGVYWR
ncbi:unnamed protein product, partial [Tetraodon nigroviridis]